MAQAASGTLRASMIGKRARGRKALPLYLPRRYLIGSKPDVFLGRTPRVPFRSRQEPQLEVGGQPQRFLVVAKHVGPHCERKLTATRSAFPIKLVGSLAKVMPRIEK